MKTKRTKLFLLAGAFASIQLLSLGGIFGADIAQAAVRNGNFFFTRGVISEQGPIFNIHTMKADGSGDLALSNDSQTNYPSTDRYGKRIVFNSGGSIYAANSDGSNRTLVLSDVGDNPPVISPDGSKFFSMKNDSMYVVNIDGTGSKDLGIVPVVTSISGAPRWSPDGSKIVYVEGIDNKPYIHVINSDGSNKKQISVQPAYSAAF